MQQALRRVAVLIPMAETSGRSVVRGIGRYARARPDWELILAHTASPDAIGRTTPREVDGVIGTAYSPELLEGYLRLTVPTVKVTATRTGSGIPTVCPDDIEVGRLAAEHLLERGLTHFAYFAQGTSFVDEARREGFIARLRTDGYACDVHEVPDIWIAERRSAAITAVGEWLRTRPRPLGVMGFSDHFGVAAIDGARRAGLHVPDDVAVVGVNDDDVLCECCNPPLTSIDYDAEEVGYQAAAMLERLMNGEPKPTASLVIRPRGVIERPSTDVLAFDDPDLTKAVRYIRERFEEPIHAADVAKHVNLSRTGLENKARRLLGRTITDEIWRVRVGRARKLLVDTDWTLPHIASASGFSTASHLSRVMHRHTGQWPTQLRRTGPAPQAASPGTRRRESAGTAAS